MSKTKINQFKEKEKYFIESLIKNGYQYVKNTKLNDVDIITGDPQNKELENKFFIKEDEKGVYIILNCFKNVGEIFALVPRIKCNIFRIENCFDVHFENIEANQVFLNSIDSYIKIENSNINELTIENSNVCEPSIKDGIDIFIQGSVNNLILKKSKFNEVYLYQDINKQYVKNIIGEFTGVEKIIIEGNVKIPIIEYPTLRSCSIRNNKFIEEVNCKKLKFLFMNNCENFSTIKNGDMIIEIDLTKTQLKEIVNYKNLKYVKVKETTSLEKIKNCPNIIELDINGKIENIENMPKLQKLNFNRSCKAQFFEIYKQKERYELSIKNCNNLTELELGNVILVEPIKSEDYINLQKIRLKNCLANIKGIFPEVYELKFHYSEFQELVDVNNFPNLEYCMSIKTSNVKKIMNGIHNTYYFYNDKQKFTDIEGLSFDVINEITKYNNSTQLMKKLLLEENIDLIFKDLHEINIKDNKDLGAAVYCRTKEQLNFLKNNNYQFREVEKNLMSEKLARIYEKYYIMQEKTLVQKKQQNNKKTIKLK